MPLGKVCARRLHLIPGGLGANLPSVCRPAGRRSGEAAACARGGLLYMQSAPTKLNPSQPVLEADEELPRQFGKYTLLRALASGGMAKVYLAIQRAVAGFEKLVVIKRILPELSRDPA